MSAGDWLGSVWQDVRHAVRSLAARPAYTIGALLSLSLGIGANAVVYSVVDAVMLHALQYPSVDRLVTLYEVRQSTPHGNFTPGSVIRVAEQVPAFSSVGAYSHWPVPSALTVPGGRTQIVDGYAATPGLFTTLKIAPLLGRLFQPQDAESGRPHVVILREAMWRQTFGADPRIVGRSISLDNTPYTVIGVISNRDAYPTETHDLWVPYLTTGAAENFNTGNMHVVARLAPGVVAEQARAQVAVVAQQLSAQHPNSWANARIELAGMRSDELSYVRPFILMLDATAVLVLLIACANTANLALGRVIGRERELAVRTALGAGRWRIARTLMTESMLLALTGGAIGILLAVVAVPVLRAHVLGDYFSRAVAGWTDMTVDWQVVLFTALLSIAVGLLFGVGLALHASKVNLTASLKEGGRGTGTGVSGSRLRTALVVTQFVLALVLTVSATLLGRSLVALLHTDPGFQTEHVLALDIGIPKGSYTKDSAVKQVNAQVVSHVQSLPGVHVAALASFLPLSHSYNSTSFTVTGSAPVADRDKPEALEYVVTAGYFPSLGVRLLRGQLWPPNTTGDTTRFAVVNQTLATHYLHGRDPIGAVLQLGWGSVSIIGVVSDTKATGVENKEPEPEVYEPMETQARNNYHLVVRVTGDPAAATRSIRNQLGTLDPNIAVGTVRTLSDVVTDYLSPWLLMVILIGGFAVIAVLIAGVGIYGVTSYSVAQRTHEIGVRMALGAQAHDVVRMVIRQALIPMLIALPVAVLGAWSVARLLGSLLYGVGATDPPTFIAVALFLFAVTAVACIVPARRAAAVSPAVSLRYE